MAQIQIPGICDPEAALQTSKQKQKFKLVIDFRDGSIAIVELGPGGRLNNEIYTEIQDMAEEEVNSIGNEISDRDFDENYDIHCDRCDKFYRPFCRLHPLYRIADKDANVENKQTTSSSYAMRTLPPLFRVAKSNIPDAGMGVFAESFIPSGMVFGPYKGKKCTSKTEFHEDGYAWEIKLRNKKDTMFVDGSNPDHSNWLRYINSPRYEKEQNMMAFQTNGKVFYRVIKPIRTNEELLVWYGDKFGTSLHKCQSKATKKTNAKEYLLL